MKRIYILLSSLILFCGWVGAQNDKLVFNEYEHDFGVIGERDGTAVFDFVMTNNSKEPVIISKVTATCGCTTPVWSKEPIAPGKTGTVTVSYNPLGRVAPFNKTITVYTNQPNPNYLKIRGEVVREKKKIVPEEVYPVAMGNYLLKTDDLQFGKVGWKEAKTIRLEVFNNSEAPITQKVLKLPKYITVNFNPVVIPAKTAATVDVNLNVQDNNFFGNLSDEITLQINDVRQSFPFTVTVLDDFSQWSSSQKANAGKINISASEINFGNFSSGNSKVLKISNSGKSLLNVRAIQSSDPSITVSKTQFGINPGEIAEIKVNADNKKIQSKLSSTLAIITDDPNRPICEIAIAANR